MKTVFASQCCGAFLSVVLASCSSTGGSNGVSRQHGPSNATASQKPVSNHVQEKTIARQEKFDVETPVENPVPISQDVLNVLRDDQRSQLCLAQEQTKEDIPTTWFVGSTVDLRGDGQQDLLVTAVNPCLFGANLNPFWIFIKTREGYRLVLTVAALGIELLNERSNGRRDIRSDSATVREVLTTIYRFNGKQYRAARSWRRKI